jgi:hemolysin III
MSAVKTPAKADLPKPKLRGLIHLIMSPVSLVAGLTLITIADRLKGRITLGIFTLAAVTLFTCSALYHRVNWKPKTKAVWRRIDHANIPLLIAGTYTPFAVFLLTHHDAVILLSLVWGGALFTAIMRISWINAPGWLYVPCYIALGWAALIYLPTFWRTGGIAVFLLIAIGGLFYTVGAVFYSLKRPNFSISWFGFHELFHACTAAAFFCHFTAAVLVVLGHR